MHEIFGLKRSQNIIQHLQDTRLVEQQTANTLMHENMKKQEQAKLRAHNEPKMMTWQLTPDYHGHMVDSSTPSNNRSSVKLPFGAGINFQDYFANTNIDNYECTPSHMNNPYAHESEFSDNYTNVGSAFYFSEFKPEMYDVEEQVIDSND